MKKDKIHLKLIAGLLGISLLSAACTGCDFFDADSSSSKRDRDRDKSSSEVDSPSADAASWTVFLYLCGTDLESDDGTASYNIDELMQVASANDQIQFVVQTGGTDTWQNDMIQSDRLQRFLITGGDITCVDEQPLASMGAATTLGDFLTWGTENYPAERYATLLWNHGGGSIGGVAYDELFDYDSLSLPELTQGLAAPGVQYEFIGFDACLMATLENAAAIAPYGKYMVASEEYIPGEGWDYTALYEYLLENPDATGEEVGISICDSYYQKCCNYDQESMATLSVTDLSKIETLLTAFDRMAQEMTGVTEDIYTLQTFSQNVRQAENYGGNTEEEGYTNLVDLGDLTINTTDVLNNTGTAVLDALFDAVVYQVNGSNRVAATGLSVFYPLCTYTEMLSDYENVSVSPNYLQFLSFFDEGYILPTDVQDEVGEMDAVDSDSYTVDFYTAPTDDSYYEIFITSGLESVMSIEYNLYYMDYDYNEYTLMGVDDDIYFDWETGEGMDNFRGVWPTIDGEYCSPMLISSEDDYNVYSIPVLLNGEETNLRAVYIWEEDGSGYYEVQGAYTGIDEDTGMSTRNFVNLQDGDEITFLFDTINWDTGEDLTYEVGTIIVEGDSVQMEESELFTGDFLYEYKITDVFGETYYSDSVIFEIEENGDIYLYETE